MAKGSQLTQLKTALADAGVSRKSQSSSKKRKRDASEARKSAEKIKEINEKLNPFDVKVTKLKHDVGGRKVKGKEGRPALKNQAGIEQVRHFKPTR
jgi:nucleolar protein 14